MEEEDISKTRNLWSETLVEGDPTLFDPKEGEIVTSKQQELIDWFNSQLVKGNKPQLRNLTSDVRSGLRIVELIEVSPKHQFELT
jgi:hypothetical protein